MTSLPSSNASDRLRDLLVGDQSEWLRSVLLAVLTQVMSAEATELCGASPGERSTERVNSRNGYRPRPFETRLGTLPLEIPKLRHGSYLPSFLEPRRRWEQAFVSVVATAYVEGVSTRKMEELIEAMGAKGISKSEVSRMASTLDGEVDAFRHRPLERPFPYIWLDATYVKVRDGGRIVSKAVLVAVGVNDQGEREVLGVQVANNEMQASWKAFLESLVARGLRDVRLAISDAHMGLRNAIRSVLNATTWQRCYVHFIRDVLSHLPKSKQGFVAAALRNVFAQTNVAHAREAMTRVIEALEQKHASVAELVRLAEDDVLAYFAFPEAHWRQVRSTNPLERLNKELRRRVRVVGLFPNDASVVRLLGMLLAEQHDEWAAGDRRYFSANSMKQLDAGPDPLSIEDRAHAAK